MHCCDGRTTPRSAPPDPAFSSRGQASVGLAIGPRRADRRYRALQCATASYRFLVSSRVLAGLGRRVKPWQSYTEPRAVRGACDPTRAVCHDQRNAASRRLT